MQVFGGETAESYYDEGLTAIVKGDVMRAGRCFKKAIELDDSFMAAHHQLAKCYVHIGQVERAVGILRRVVAAKPRLIPAKLDLAYALLEQGHQEEARKLFLDITEAQPNNARATLGLANVCFMEGNWDGAVTLAQEARVKGGDSFSALFLLGRATKLAGAKEIAKSVLDDADSLLDKSVELNPDQPEGHYLRGELAFVLDKFPAALRHYRDADDRAKDGEAYLAFGEHFTRLDILAKQGLCLQRLGKRDDARDLGRRIIKANPDHKIGQALAELQ